MSQVRDLHDFSLFFFGLVKFKAFFLKGGGRKNRVNRVIAYSGISQICLNKLERWCTIRLKKVINILTNIYIKLYRL